VSGKSTELEETYK